MLNVILVLSVGVLKEDPRAGWMFGGLGMAVYKTLLPCLLSIGIEIERLRSEPQNVTFLIHVDHKLLSIPTHDHLT